MQQRVHEFLPPLLGFREWLPAVIAMVLDVANATEYFEVIRRIRCSAVL